MREKLNECRPDPGRRTLYSDASSLAMVLYLIRDGNKKIKVGSVRDGGFTISGSGILRDSPGLGSAGMAGLRNINGYRQMAGNRFYYSSSIITCIWGINQPGDTSSSGLDPFFSSLCEIKRRAWLDPPLR